MSAQTALLQVPDMSRKDSYGNALGCKCKAGFYRSDPACDSTRSGQCLTFVCTACPAGMAPSRDGTVCVTCGTAVASSTIANVTNATTSADPYPLSALDATTKDCSCPSTAYRLNEFSM
jgi:hypothetical protein